MADFRPMTEAELRALQALAALQRKLGRLEVRLAIKQAQIRVARTLKAARPMHKLTDVRWHAQITAAEAHALQSLGRGIATRRLLTKMLTRTVVRVEAALGAQR
jgi:hypothetical protein